MARLYVPTRSPAYIAATFESTSPPNRGMNRVSYFQI
jgi:hypothetical protein